MFVDFSSKPPIDAFADKGAHMDNYNRIYGSTKKEAASAAVVDQKLQAYLDTYERLNAKHVVLKARDLESTYGFKVSNEDVAAFCGQYGERYIGFASVDPYKGAKAIRELEAAVSDLGMCGLHLPCFELKLAINDPRLYPLYAKCIELDIPVALHAGVNFSTVSPIKGSHPMMLDEVMVHFPELRVVVAPPGWPWVNDLIAVAWRHRNVFIGIMAVRPKYLAVPNSGYESLLQYGTSVLKDRMIFGSAFPLMTVEQALSDIDGLSLTSDIKKKWICDNALAFLRRA